MTQTLRRELRLKLKPIVLASKVFHLADCRAEEMDVEKELLDYVDTLCDILSDAALEVFYKPTGLTEKDVEQANSKVDAIIASSKTVKYRNRDLMPEQYLHFSDAYNELTKQEPTKRVIQDWMLTFSEWIDEGLTVENIEEAYKHASRPEGGFLVARPGSLTNTAVAMKSKINRFLEIDHMEVERTKKMLDEKFNKPYTPPSAEFLEKMKKLVKEKTLDGDTGVNRPSFRIGANDRISKL